MGAVHNNDDNDDNDEEIAVEHDTNSTQGGVSATEENSGYSSQVQSVSRLTSSKHIHPETLTIEGETILEIEETIALSGTPTAPSHGVTVRQAMPSGNRTVRSS